MAEIQPSQVIDARDLEPPEPFVQTMESLDLLVPGDNIRLLLRREPFPLYRALALNGFEWKTTHASDGTVEVLMWHKLRLGAA